MYTKRISMPKTWPIPRKKYVYISSPKSSQKRSYCLPIISILRDLLHLVKNSKEAKKIIKAGLIEVNGSIIHDEKIGVGLLDIIYIEKINKIFVVWITKKGKLFLKEINEKKKIAKIIGKKIQNKGKIQLNLSGGINLIVEGKFRVNDSVIIDLKKKKVIKYLPLEKNSLVLIVSGRYSGETGKVQEIIEKNVQIKLEKKEIKIPLRNIIVIEPI